VNKSPRFKLVFTKLRESLEPGPHAELSKAPIEIKPPLEMSREELEEIDDLRRIVLEVTDPEPMSFTTT